MTNYQRGARCEYQARDALEQAGYFVVRSAGSHGAVDLVALPFDGGRPLLVQCKRGTLRRADVKALGTALLPAGVIVELWHFTRGAPVRYRRVGTDLLHSKECGKPPIADG